MTKPAQLLLFIVFLCIGWVACDQERDPCLQPRTVVTRLHTYRVMETDTGVAVFDSTLPKPIIGVVDSPNVFAYLKPASQFAVILSPLADSTKLFVIPDSAKQTQFDKDTITLFYRRKLQFISTACGYTYYYSIFNEHHTTNNIDSVKIFNGEVTNNVNVEHIKIYF